MPRVVLSAYNVANVPEVGGHFWVYLQYALGLMQNGCDVWWLETYTRGDPDRDRHAIARFLARMANFGLGGKVILLASPGKRAPLAECEFATVPEAQANRVFESADLLLNFHYAIDPGLLARFCRTALVDIDPGLLQHWLHHRQITVADHDLWFTTGETVGLPDSRIPDCGRDWRRIRPCVSLAHWPVAFDPAPAPFTTVSSWQSREWIKDGPTFYENNKRVTFLDYRELPRHVDQPLELALFFHAEDDAGELEIMRDGGWSIRHSREVAGSPEEYRNYVRRSRGEFSCAKPSCMAFQNAWVSDRTLCYLASGKPVVVQDTGPSAYLPNGEGMFRFSNPDEAREAIAAINADYSRHAHAARDLAEAYFDAAQVTRRILEQSGREMLAA